MAVTLRLTRRGSSKRPFYRIVAATKDKPRDGRFLEIVGWYNPRAKGESVSMQLDRVRFWVERGAEVSSVVASLIKKQIPGFLEERTKHQSAKIQAARKKRKARAASGGKKSAPKKSAAKTSAKKA